jgi:hypothetical protein
MTITRGFSAPEGKTRGLSSETVSRANARSPLMIAQSAINTTVDGIFVSRMDLLLSYE